jgi:hypothetical protein
MSPTEITGETVVRGIVIPIAWDRFGQPLRVAILTPDEGEYPVAPRGLGRRLFRFVREEIKARIALEQGAEGEEQVRVLSFTIVRHGDADGQLPDPAAPDDPSVPAAGRS